MGRQHINLFPCGRTVSAELLQEANASLNMLAFGKDNISSWSDWVLYSRLCSIFCPDIATSETSTAPYDFDDTQKLLSVTRDIKGAETSIFISLFLTNPRSGCWI